MTDEPEIRADLALLGADAPDLVPPLAVLVAGGRRRLRLRNAVAGVTAVVLLGAAGGGFEIARPHDRASLSAQPAATTAPPATAPPATAPPATAPPATAPPTAAPPAGTLPAVTVTPSPYPGAVTAIEATDGSWSVAVRRSTTSAGLICQDLRRAGVTDRNGAQVAIPACAGTVPTYASLHDAYVDRADGTQPGAEIEFGRVPAGTKSVQLSAPGAPDVTATVAPADGLLFWAAEVPRTYTAGYVDGAGTEHPLSPDARTACAPLGPDRAEQLTSTPCPDPTAPPMVEQEHPTPAATALQQRIAALLPAGWTLSSGGAVQADGTPFERVTGTAGGDLLDVLVQHSTRPHDLRDVQTLHHVTTDPATGIQTDLESESGSAQAIVQLPAGLFVNVVDSPQSGTAVLTLDQVHAIATALTGETSTPEATAVQPTPSLDRPLVVTDPQGIALLAAGARTELTGTSGAQFPELSRSGRYVSWLTPTDTAANLHIRDLHSSQADRVIVGVRSATWSPVADSLAACGPDSLQIIRPARASITVGAGSCYYPPVWSADGSRLASGDLGRTGSVFTLTSSTGPGRPPALLATLPYSAGIARFVGDDALLAWPDPSFSGSIAADGLTLTEYDLSSGEAFPLTTTLTYRDWVQPLRPADTFVIVAGGDREAHDGKHPETWVIPEHPAPSDPPHQVSAPAVSIPEGTSLTSIAVAADGTVATVTVPDSPDLGSDPVNGTLAVAGDNAKADSVEDVGAVVATTSGAGTGFLAIKDGALVLVNPGGPTPLGPITSLLATLPSAATSPIYYTHVDPAVLLGQPPA